MPRASWRGFLRLSLVSCPIVRSPAASRTKPIRLRQVWRPGLADEGDQSPELARPQQVTAPSLPDLCEYDGGYDADQPQPVTRVTIRPHDPRTGEEIDKAEVFRRFGPARSLPLNDLPGENRGTAGRIGEVGVTLFPAIGAVCWYAHHFGAFLAVMFVLFMFSGARTPTGGRDVGRHSATSAWPGTHL